MRKTKHIDIAHHFVRKRVETGELEVMYIPTDDMIADNLTKAPTTDKHRQLPTTNKHKKHFVGMRLSDSVSRLEARLNGICWKARLARLEEGLD
jgi:hypothetical protein